jgi:hypothetical protein
MSLGVVILSIYTCSNKSLFEKINKQVMTMDNLRWKIIKKAGEYNPDPISYKAFMSEFKQGLDTGFDTSPDPLTIEETEELAANSAKDLLDFAKGIESIIARGTPFNERQVVPKLSGILSTLLYNTGKLRGLKYQ